VMVPAEKIIDTAVREKVEFVGLSGLITPSLEEMAFVASEFDKKGFTIPLLIGGATTSQLHTAVKIAPCYKSPVAHVQDASLVVQTCSELSGFEKNNYIANLRDMQNRMREGFQRRGAKQAFVSLEEARRLKMNSDWARIERARPSRTGVFDLPVSLERLIEFFD